MAQYWMYGLHACHAALNNPKRSIHTIHILPKHESLIPQNHQRKIQIVTPKELDALFKDSVVHQGIALKVDPLSHILSNNWEEKSRSRYLVLDGLEDVHNLGAALRCAAAFDARGVIVQEEKNIHENGVLAKIASGALERVPLIKVVNISNTLKELKKQGFWILGFCEKGEDMHNQLKTFEHCVLVFGSEGKGMRPLVSKQCDVLLKYQTADFSTLNLSTACAIALHDHFRG